MDTLTLDFSVIGINTPHGTIAAEVADDGMASSGIAAGDVVLVCPRPPKAGDIVAVELEGGIVLRRFDSAAVVSMLRSDSPESAELAAARNSVLGVAVGLIRKLR